MPLRFTINIPRAAENTPDFVGDVERMRALTGQMGTCKEELIIIKGDDKRIRKVPNLEEDPVSSWGGSRTVWCWLSGLLNFG